MPASPARIDLVRRPSQAAFTLIEILTATAVFAMMMVLLFSALTHVNGVWQQADGQKTRRQNARILLDTMARDLQAAVIPMGTNAATPILFQMNPGGPDPDTRGDALYWQVASSFRRNGNDIGTVGYYVSPANDTLALCRLYTNAPVADPWTYRNTLAPATPPDYEGLLAENVLAMFVTLYDKSGAVIAEPGETYSSPNPPAFAEIALVIADGRALQRVSGPLVFEGASADALFSNLPPAVRSHAQIFRTRVDLPPAP